MELTISIFCDIVFVFEKFFIIYYRHQGEVENIIFLQSDHFSGNTSVGRHFFGDLAPVKLAAPVIIELNE